MRLRHDLLVVGELAVDEPAHEVDAIEVEQDLVAAAGQDDLDRVVDVGQVEAAVEGDGTTIAFNARYLADVLTNVDADQFALELNGPLSPGVFKPIGDDQYVHVVMPVRTAS